jgi:hypothetical protein
MIEVVALEIVEVQGGARQWLCFAKGVRLGQGVHALGVLCVLQQLAAKVVRAVEGAAVRKDGCLVVVVGHLV